MWHSASWVFLYYEWKAVKNEPINRVAVMNLVSHAVLWWTRGAWPSFNCLTGWLIVGDCILISLG